MLDVVSGGGSLSYTIDQRKQTFRHLMNYSESSMLHDVYCMIMINLYFVASLA